MWGIIGVVCNPLAWARHAETGNSCSQKLCVLVSFPDWMLSGNETTCCMHKHCENIIHNGETATVYCGELYLTRVNFNVCMKCWVVVELCAILALFLCLNGGEHLDHFWVVKWSWRLNKKKNGTFANTLLCVTLLQVFGNFMSIACLVCVYHP